MSLKTQNEEARSKVCSGPETEEQVLLRELNNFRLIAFRMYGFKSN